MHQKGQMLANMAKWQDGFSPPQSLAEAEAILIQLAGPFVDSHTSRSSVTGESSHKKVPPTSKRNSADIQRAISAVQKFSVAFESVPDALVIVDCEGMITFVNSQLEKQFGFTRDEILGQPVEVLVPERFRESHPAKRQAYFDDPHVRPMGAGLALHGRHHDGHEFPVEISLSPVDTDAGVMVVASIRDLSEKQKTEAQVRRFEARYRTLVEGLPAVTFMAALDEGTNELYVSPQIETLLGFSQTEWLGNPILWYTQLHPDDRNRWHTEFAVTCATGSKFNSIYRFYSRSGRVVWVHGEAKVIRDEQGRPLFLQGVAFDITQLKEAEEQLKNLNQTLESRVQERTSELSATNESLQLEIQERQKIEAEVRRINDDLARAHQEAINANQIKSQFLANMSHELRTPLNAIIGYSELLQLLSARKNDDTYTADLQRINNAGKHLLTLINDILDISKIEAGKMQLELEVISVEPLIDDIRETIEPLAMRNSNKLEIEIPGKLGMVQVDVIRLKQCLLNLLSNACKFTNAGRVIFSVTQEFMDAREWMVFQIQDTGIGLTDEQASRLFQPFTQADGSTTRRFGGTGLGLAITKKLCEAMNGQISLKSQIGKGSSFTIRFPIYQSL